MGIRNLTKKQIQNIQIDEGIIFLNYGLPTQRLLAPTRGGGEFTANATVRDIEFDGRHGKTAEMQTIEEQDVSIKVTTIDMSQENLALAIPNCVIEDDDGKTIRNPRTGVIVIDSYLENVTMFAKTLEGKYKKMTIYKAMHEGGLNAKAVQKAEGELALEFAGHYTKEDLDGDLWEVTDVTDFAAPIVAAARTLSATEIEVTFNTTLDTATLHAEDFSVSVSDVTKAVTGKNSTARYVKTFTLITTGLASGKTITLSHTKGHLCGENGVKVESFTAQPVENTLT